MQIKLTKEDLEKAQKIDQVFKNNMRAKTIFSEYLNYHSQMINKSLIEQITKEGVSDEYAYKLLFTMFNETESNEFKKQYLAPAFTKLNVSKYLENPYYQNLLFENYQINNCSLKTLKYEPYEAFVYNEEDIDLDTYQECLKIGYFSTTFTYPALLENNQEWMTVTPNEVETMQQAIEEAKGHVLTFGLGLGYYAYMASLKKEVLSVTIIENNDNIIKLFNKYILPKFKDKTKIKIIKEEALTYLQKDNLPYNYAFVDIWHDISDGLVLYLKIKKLEKKHPQITFNYWIEKSLRNSLRYSIYIIIFDKIEGIKKEYENEILKKLGEIFKNVEIFSFNEIKYYLSEEYFTKIIQEF